MLGEPGAVKVSSKEKRQSTQQKQDRIKLQEVDVLKVKTYQESQLEKK